VRLAVFPEGEHLIVSVTNQVGAASEHVARLRHRIALVASIADPAEAFRAALQQISRRDPDTSGLGLARVRYEGDCRLELDLSREGEVTIRARCALSSFSVAARAGGS
jgi:hypothetical protein